MFWRISVCPHAQMCLLLLLTIYKCKKVLLCIIKDNKVEGNIWVSIQVFLLSMNLKQQILNANCQV